MNAVAATHLDRATCIAQQAVVDNAETRNKQRLSYLDPAEVASEQQLSSQMAASAERQLLAAVRAGDIRRARALLLQAAQAHAHLRGLNASLA